MSAADLAALTPSQAAGFTASLIGAMSATQWAALAINPVIASVAANETNGTLSYSGALAVLHAAASGGMTQSNFAALTSIAPSLASGAIQASAYVAEIFDDVVLGNSADAWWTGGATSRVALGDLTAASSETQVDELIGKWFLGTDLPNPYFSSVAPTLYEQQTTPLYGASGAPQMTDVSQGRTGDCYFEASIAEIALQDPTAIENALQANGNGTYSVKFQVNGQADYVTVNDQLPNLGGNWTYGDGQTLIYDNGYGAAWSALLEKAFVQLNEQAAAFHGSDGVAANSCADISGGGAWPLTYLTGEAVTPYWSGSIVGGDASMLGVLQADLANHGEVLMATGSGAPPSGSNLVPDHMFAVTGVDAAAGTVSLYNPWGRNGGNYPASFTDTIAILDADGGTYFATPGKIA